MVLRDWGAVRPLNILHILRAPVGGLFRHVVDLARGQAARGHNVGLVADAITGAERAEATLAELAPQLAHGILRVPMSRHMGFSDLAAQRTVSLQAKRCDADVIHGHGAKGGAYARLTPKGRAIRAYTPHGGSLHYRATSPVGAMYLSLERILMTRSELMLFESAYGRDVFRAQIGNPKCPTRVVHNGVGESDFDPVGLDRDATDILFIGELRTLKGVDVLIDALGLLAAEGARVTATIVGDGPDAEQFKTQARAAGLGDAIVFPGALPARGAFGRGKVLIVPSRAESLPYVVLEAAAAGVPQIATAVGGIPEIFGADAESLLPPGDAPALAQAIKAALADLSAARQAALRLQARVSVGFSVDAMTDQVLAAYEEAGASGSTRALLRSH